MNVGARIRALRQQRHWTQQILAEEANLPGPWTVSRLETRGTDSLGTLEVVCKALDIEVWELLKLEEKPLNSAAPANLTDDESEI